MQFKNGELNSGELGGKQEQAHDETCFGGCFFVSEMTSMSMLPAIGLQPTRRVKTGHFSGNLFMAHA